MRKLLTLLAAFGAVQLALVGTAQAAEPQPQPAPAPQHHIVEAGESLSSIATKYQLESWRPLWNVNPGVAHPDQIDIGQDLVVPNSPTVDRPLPEGVTVEPVAVQAAPAVARATTRAVAAAPAPVAASGDFFARLRQCESGNNYSNKRNPTYRGAYQFSYGTWQSVGGSGDPADASPAEQDMRAKMLYDRRGASPWPVCGRR